MKDTNIYIVVTIKNNQLPIDSQVTKSIILFVKSSKLSYDIHFYKTCIKCCI